MVTGPLSSIADAAAPWLLGSSLPAIRPANCPPQLQFTNCCTARHAKEQDGQARNTAVAEPYQRLIIPPQLKLTVSSSELRRPVARHLDTTCAYHYLGLSFVARDTYQAARISPRSRAHRQSRADGLSLDVSRQRCTTIPRAACGRPAPFCLRPFSFESASHPRRLVTWPSQLVS